MAREAQCNFTLDDINRLSLDTPCLCKVASAVQHYHMEDVYRAGGIMSLLKELDRGGLLHCDTPTVHSTSIGEAVDYWDITDGANSEAKDLSRQHQVAYGLPRLSRKVGVGIAWTLTAKVVAFVRCNMLTPARVVWPCSMATYHLMAVL